MTADEIARLRALCAAATPGPWYAADQDASDYNGHTLAGSDGELKTTVTTDPKKEGWRVDGGFSDYMITVRDAAFIAAARTALPAALDEVDRLRGCLGKAVRLLHMLDDQEARHPDVAEFLDGLDAPEPPKST